MLEACKNSKHPACGEFSAWRSEAAHTGAWLEIFFFFFGNDMLHRFFYPATQRRSLKDPTRERSNLAGSTL